MKDRYYPGPKTPVSVFYVSFFHNPSIAYFSIYNLQLSPPTKSDGQRPSATPSIWMMVSGRYLKKF